MSGKRAVRLLIALVVGALIGWLGAEVIFPDEAHGQAKYCVTDSGLDCGTWSHRHARKFRHDKIPDSEGFLLPRRVRRMMNHEANQMHAEGKMTMLLRDDNSGWWRAPFSNLACVVSPVFAYNTPTVCGDGGIAESDSRAYHRIAWKTTGVTLLCGGAAVLGSLKGGGWWGAGIGGLACFWNMVIERIFFGG